MRKRIIPAVAVTLCLCGLRGSAWAQDHEHHRDAQPAANGWSWTPDASVFFGYNYQQRKFADFTAWESQNWFMLEGNRKVGGGRLSLDVMLSAEPFTIKSTGSPQLFQTGESYLLTQDGVEYRIPLLNNQHPHDLFMALGATYRVEQGATAYYVGADLVGAATLGPTAFMHRESSRSNPQVPLTHHYMDSTHISAGVVRGGIDIHGLTLEASAFRGEEPDEHRADIEPPKLNSWAVRGGWHRGPWQAQVSGGQIHEPEWFDPFDVTRITASLAFNGTVASRQVAMTAAWGENRMFNGYQNTEDGYLLEWNVRADRRTTIYGRAEVAAKHLFGLVSHPKGFTHPHSYSDTSALTFGVLRDLPIDLPGRIGIGADATLYRMSADLDEFYAGSHSYHVFLRWRP